MKDSVVVGKIDGRCKKNDNYSAINHPLWMINTLFDIDCLAQYEPYHISRKRGKGARNGV